MSFGSSVCRGGMLLLMFLSLMSLSACSGKAEYGVETSTGLPIIYREGSRPETSDAPQGTNVAHQQLSQNASVETQEKVWEFMTTLEGMSTGATKISVPGARAVFTPDMQASAMAANERLHLHPSTDGSLHLSVPDPSWAQHLETYGRGEVHPRNPLAVMLYGPRSDLELEVLKDVVMAVYVTHER